MVEAKSEIWKEKFSGHYREALKQVDILNKKFNLAMAAMSEVDSDSTEIDDAVKEMVRYEMAVRFGMEKHRAVDICFANVSSVLDMHDRNGKRVVCPGVINDVCKAGKNKADKTCRRCGGLGYLVDHSVSMYHKLLYSLMDVTRLLAQGGMPGAGGQGQSNMQMLEAAYEQMWSAGLRDEDARHGLLLMAENMGLEKADAEAFIEGYNEYCKQRAEADGGSDTGFKLEQEKA